MRFKRVSKNLRAYKAVKRLYHQSFPRSERAPFWLLVKRAGQPIADFWALYDRKRWVGIAYVIKYRKLAYIFYLAIRPEHQGRGYGGKTIELLKKHYKGRKLFLALEPLEKSAPNYEQRVRRHSFYEKCGLTDLPHRIKEATVIYDIMGIGEAVEPEEYREMMDKYFGKFLNKIIDTRILPD